LQIAPASLLLDSAQVKLNIVLGNLNAYYDPDLLLKNNPFCSIGFDSGIVFKIDGVIVKPAYTIDPGTNEI
jgi:hypothetical protein